MGVLFLATHQSIKNVKVVEKHYAPLSADLSTTYMDRQPREKKEETPQPKTVHVEKAGVVADNVSAPAVAEKTLPAFFDLGIYNLEQIYNYVDRELKGASSKSDACSRLSTLQNMRCIQMTQFSDEEKAACINSYIRDREIINTHLGTFTAGDFRVSRTRK